MSDHVTIKRDADGLVRLILSRPEKHNAMSGETLDALTQAAQDLAKDEQARVVVLEAEGKSFCAGGDLAWMRAQFEADESIRRDESAKVGQALYALDQLPQPLIGAVQGNAVGGGLGLLAVCDAVVAVDHAKFGFTETRLGVIPANIAPFVIRRMGPGPARQVLMSARIFGAGEAQTLGLVSQVVAAEDLAGAVLAQAAPYFDCAPGAVAETKALLRDLGYGVAQNQMEIAAEALAARWQTQEAQSGIAAFFAKEPAPWRQKG